MPGFFEKISSVFGLSGSSGKSVLGLDIGSSSVKVVQLRKEKNVAILETYGEISLGPYVEESVGRAVNPPTEKKVEAIKDLLREADVTTQDVGMTIPYSSSLISFIEVPNLSNEKLAKMIPIEARKYVPVSMSEVVLDWFVIPKQAQDIKEEEKGKKVNVMLVAIHNNILDDYKYINNEAKLSVSFFEIEIFSVIRSVMGRGTSPSMIIDVGAGSTKLYIVERGVVKYSHSIAKGGQDVTLAISRSLGISFEDAEKIKRKGEKYKEKKSEAADSIKIVTDYILSESSKVLLNFQRKNKKNITDVVLTGGGVFLEGFLEKAKNSLEAEVHLADPFSKLKTPAFLEDALKEAGPEFSAAIGASLRKLEEVG